MKKSNNYYIHNSQIVNEGKIIFADVLIQNGVIKLVLTDNFALEDILLEENTEFIDAKGLFLIPGVIDTHVHFREPGLTHKADIYSESRAAVAGGVTSFIDMPNTIPNTISEQYIEEKFNIASKSSLANFSFYMGVSNNNIDELINIDNKHIAGIKIFFGSSTGNMITNNLQNIEKIFACSKLLIAAHCEDDNIIKKNLQKYIQQFGDNIPIDRHAAIRSSEACFNSSKYAVSLAKKYNTRLHILHISTSQELALFDHKIPVDKKFITSETTVNHLWFNFLDYEKFDTQIKCNPSIKSPEDQNALLIGVLSNKIDTISTDHAPHTIDEKNNYYTSAPSGIPSIQHSLLLMLELYHQGKLTIEKIVEKMCHNPAKCYKIEKRGFIRPGNFADLVLVDLNCENKILKNNLLYKCGWSPFDDIIFHSKIEKTFVNGYLVYDNGKIIDDNKGQKLTFNRN